MHFLLFLPLFTAMGFIHITASHHESRHSSHRSHLSSLPLALTAPSPTCHPHATAAVRNDSSTRMPRPRHSRSTSSLHPSGKNSDTIRSALLRRISTQILCEGDQLQLACGNSSRIIVINAWFGVMGLSKIRQSLGLPPLSCQQNDQWMGSPVPPLVLNPGKFDRRRGRES